MQLLSSTPLVLTVLLAIISVGALRGLPIVFALLPMGMLALVNLPALGGMTVLAIDAAIVVMCLMLAFRPNSGATLLEIFGPGTAGGIFLLFLVYAVLSSFFLPRVFAGETEVFGISRIEGVRGIVALPLRPTGGNLSQAFRIGLSTLAFAATAFYVLRRPDPAPILAAIKVATAVHVGMGVLDIATQSAGASYLLDWARTANYSLTLGQQLAGLNRVIGGFPEASAFGYLSLGLFGFWFARWIGSERGDREAALYCLAALLILLRTTSSSAYVGLALFVSAFFIYRFLTLQQSAISRRAALILILFLAAAPFALMGTFVLYELNAGFSSFLDRSLLNKLTSSSGVERMSWNAQAVSNAWDTWLMGAGLGSVRASSWLISTLANTGLIGLALILWALARLFLARLDGLPDDLTALGLALKMCCAGFLARAMVVKATPDLGIAFYCAAGLAAGLALHAARQRRHASDFLRAGHAVQAQTNEQSRWNGPTERGSRRT